jgi:hypothetical protein
MPRRIGGYALLHLRIRYLFIKVISSGLFDK